MCAPCLPAWCRSELSGKAEALAALTSEKEELEARHTELRWVAECMGGWMGFKWGRTAA